MAFARFLVCFTQELQKTVHLFGQPLPDILPHDIDDLVHILAFKRLSFPVRTDHGGFSIDHCARNVL